MNLKLTLLMTLTAVALLRAEGPARDAGAEVEIVTDQAAASIFPESWRTPRIDAKAELVDAALQERCREIVARALGLYPAGVLRANLKRVYVLGRLSYFHVYTGGTRSKSVVYLVRNERIPDALFESNLHAEFSSILLRNHPKDLDTLAWEAVNPSGFRYRGAGVDAVRNGQASLRLADSLHEEGFLNEYGKASVEEDFNSYAARLLMGDAALWRAVERFPKVRAKAELAMAFYGKLDGGFTAEFFERRRQAQAR